MDNQVDSGRQQSGADTTKNNIYSRRQHYMSKIHDNQILYTVDENTTVADTTKYNA